MPRKLAEVIASGEVIACPVCQSTRFVALMAFGVDGRELSMGELVCFACQTTFSLARRSGELTAFDPKAEATTATAAKADLQAEASADLKSAPKTP